MGGWIRFLLLLCMDVVVGVACLYTLRMNDAFSSTHPPTHPPTHPTLYKCRYQLYLDDLPIWGMVGEADEEGKRFVYTHRRLEIGYNGPNVIEVRNQPTHPPTHVYERKRKRLHPPTHSTRPKHTYKQRKANSPNHPPTHPPR